MRCQRCGFELPTDRLDCERCDKQHRAKSTGIPAYLSYFLSILINAAGLVIALAIFRALTDSFEVIVVSLLTIIYLTIKEASGMNTLSVSELAKSFYHEMKHEGRAEQRKYAEDQHTRAWTKMYINAIFDAMVYFVALVNLIGAL